MYWLLLILSYLFISGESSSSSRSSSTCETQEPCLDITRESLSDGQRVEVCLTFEPFTNECITYNKDSSDSSSSESYKFSECETVDCGSNALFGIAYNGCAATNGLNDISIAGIDGISCSPNSSRRKCKWSIPAEPTRAPTNDPTADPTTDPTVDATDIPTTNPTIQPSINPSTNPTLMPTINPTVNPTNIPTSIPTTNPTAVPSSNPTNIPTTNPTMQPSMNPTIIPTTNPTSNPSSNPTAQPTTYPSTNPTANPTVNPTNNPSMNPTSIPTANPTSNPSMNPTSHPTNNPTTNPTNIPTANPTDTPTANPTSIPTTNPTINPTNIPTSNPTDIPTISPTMEPTIEPTIDPTNIPTTNPTAIPTMEPTTEPTINPTSIPTMNPTTIPSSNPTNIPTINPTTMPSVNPTMEPTTEPTMDPTMEPTMQPSVNPTNEPTMFVKEYVLLNGGATWADGIFFCGLVGMQLATFENEDELQAIYDVCDQERCWLGFADLDLDGNYTFIGTEDKIFPEYWDTGNSEPNGVESFETCELIDSMNCSTDSYDVICETVQGEISQPAQINDDEMNDDEALQINDDYDIATICAGILCGLLIIGAIIFGVCKSMKRKGKAMFSEEQQQEHGRQESEERECTLNQTDIELPYTSCAVTNIG